MSISFANERKMQARWVAAIGWKIWKWPSANNTLPKGSPCHVQDLDEMNVRSSCLEAFKKYSGDGCAQNRRKNGES
jgi:hypothetical protein